MKFACLFMLLCLSLTGTLKAQDSMYLTNTKKPFQVKIYDVGIDEIKYRPWGDTVIPVLVLPRMNVSKIVFANGSVVEFKDTFLTNDETYANQHKNAFKFHLLSPLFKHVAFSYERSLKQGRSYELGVGIIGTDGSDAYEFAARNPRGIFARVGYKVLANPNFNSRGKRYTRVLIGGYVKPEIIFGNYTLGWTETDKNYKVYNMSRDVVCGAFVINFGKQWAFDQFLLFDLYYGIGYGTSNYSAESYKYSSKRELYHYAFLGGWSEFPLVFTAGIKVGFLFGKKKK